MKYFLSFIIAVLMCSVFTLVAYSAETDAELIEGYLCDVDGDDEITAADARIILRASVSLEKPEVMTLLFADADSDGNISASDARTALRMSVGLEDNEVYSFTVEEMSEPDCENSGYIKAVCLNNDVTVYITAEKLGHSFSRNALCEGTGKCVNCGGDFDFTPEHKYETDKCAGIKSCVYCHDAEYFTAEHSFSGNTCTRCGYIRSGDIYNELLAFVTKNGTNEDGFYSYVDTFEGEEFALCYDRNYDDLYIAYFISSEIDGYVIDYYCYFDIPYDLESYCAEVYCYMDDTLYAYGIYTVDASRLSYDGVRNAVQLIEFDSVDYLQEVKSEFAVIAEGISVIDLVWLIDLAERTGLSSVTAEALGCPQLGI